MSPILHPTNFADFAVLYKICAASLWLVSKQCCNIRRTRSDYLKCIASHCLSPPSVLFFLWHYDGRRTRFCMVSSPQSKPWRQQNSWERRGYLSSAIKAPIAFSQCVQILTHETLRKKGVFYDFSYKPTKIPYKALFVTHFKKEKGDWAS